VRVYRERTQAELISMSAGPFYELHNAECPLFGQRRTSLVAPHIPAVGGGAGHRAYVGGRVAPDYFPLDGDLSAGPLLLPGFPGIFETS